MVQIQRTTTDKKGCFRGNNNYLLCASYESSGAKGVSVSDPVRELHDFLFVRLNETMYVIT